LAPGQRKGIGTGGEYSRDCKLMNGFSGRDLKHESRSGRGTTVAAFAPTRR
jgi:hypothetical protein